MKKPTIRQLAEMYSVSHPIIASLKKRGVDIYDKEAVRGAILKQLHRPKAWVGGCPWDDKPEAAPVIQPDGDVEKLLYELEKQALNAVDYDEARFVRTKIQALKEFKAVQIQERDYISIEEVKADLVRFCTGVKTSLFRLQADLPPMIEGLGASEMQKKIKTKVNEILDQLSDESSDIYK